ncbi:MAG: hypothetical protein LBT40_08335 [Deltaproteobacteria bacterium]|nr:hypothetical protein [Deltaproteobacteria bacterium]
MSLADGRGRGDLFRSRPGRDSGREGTGDVMFRTGTGSAADGHCRARTGEGGAGPGGTGIAGPGPGRPGDGQGGTDGGRKDARVRKAERLQAGAVP